MTFAFIVKTIITKWTNTLSKKVFSTALVRQETQMPVPLVCKNSASTQKPAALSRNASA